MKQLRVFLKLIIISLRVWKQFPWANKVQAPVFNIAVENSHMLLLLPWYHTELGRMKLTTVYNKKALIIRLFIFRVHFYGCQNVYFCSEGRKRRA
jgi:hypothetical protein